MPLEGEMPGSSQQCTYAEDKATIDRLQFQGIVGFVKDL